MYDKEYKEILKNMFVNKGEYNFDDESKAQRFVDKVLYFAENTYSTEGYHHKYEHFKEFLYTSVVDGIAYDVYEGEYGDY